MTASGPLRMLLVVMFAITWGCAGVDGGNGEVSAAQGGTSDADHVVLDGRRLLLVPGDGGEPRHLVSLDHEDGEVVHLSLRPGDHPGHVVLGLLRIDDPGTPRYELRYLVAYGAEVTDLYWFPWRLQIDERIAAVSEVPPTPVWAPDGAALAWIEWDAAGTWLRTVGWLDHAEGSNPSDDTTRHLLGEVPPGAQLEAWTSWVDTTATFTARVDGERRVIQVERPPSALVTLP